MTKQGKRTIVLVLLLAVLAAAFCAWRYYDTTYIQINGNQYHRNIDALDLSGTDKPELDKIMELKGLVQLNLKDTGLTAGEYDTLRFALPKCQISWDVPFQGGYLDCSIHELELNSLNETEMDTIRYFSKLTSIHAASSMEPAMVDALIAAYPNIPVTYDVTISGQLYTPEVTELTFTGADLDEVSQKLKYLPNLSYVEFTDDNLDIETMVALTQQYPGIEFQFSLDFLGKKVMFLDTFVDISDVQLTSVEEVEYLASVMPKLEKVDMLNCGISNEEMGALNDRDEDTLFVWLVDFGPYHKGYRTDIDQFIPVKQHIWLNDEDLYNLRYCTELVGLDLGHHLMKSIDFVQYMPKLRYLIIADTRVTDITPVTGLENLIFFEMFGSLVEDYSPLLTLTGLEDLNLSYTRGDPNIVAQMTWLKRLWWRDFPGLRITLEEQQMLRTALPHVEMRFDAGSSTGEGWRKGYLYFEMRDFFGMEYMTE